MYLVSAALEFLYITSVFEQKWFMFLLARHLLNSCRTGFVFFVHWVVHMRSPNLVYEFFFLLRICLWRSKNYVFLDLSQVFLVMEMLFLTVSENIRSVEAIISTGTGFCTSWFPKYYFLLQLVRFLDSYVLLVFYILASSLI